MKRLLWCVLAILAGTASAVAGQEGPASGPMTYALARKANYVPLETLREARSRIPAPLARRVTIEREGVLLQQVLLDIANQAELGLSYGEELVRARVVVSLSAKNEAAADALQQATEGTDWAVLVTPAGQVAVLRREPAQVGVIVGHVTDAKTGSAIVGATVVIEGTSRSTATAGDGTYRFAEVAPGTYRLRARYIGYAPGAVSVTVTADQEAIGEFSLEKSAQPLDELVTVTPGGMQAEVKALPSPITVITAADIEAQRPQTINDLLRQLTPSAVGFDLPSQPATTVFSLRGGSSLAGGGTAKVFVDGIESANRVSTPVDPASIERIEVIRGPQAATIYGPDAAGGVIQIFTKRGDPNLVRPQVTLEAEAGVQETPYQGFRSVLRQTYSASMRGGVPNATYNLGVNYSRLGDWLPNGDISRQVSPSAFAGLRYERGIVTVDVSGRYLITSNGPGLNPLLFQLGFVPLSRPQFLDQRFTNRTFGAALGVTPVHWWRNRLTVGYDESSSDRVQKQPRLTTPADTFFNSGSTSNDRAFVSYNTELGWAPSSEVSGTLTAGIDYYRLATENTDILGALNVDGTIALGPSGAFNVSRTTMTNTGYFTQLVLGIRDKVFVTGSLRADRNSTFGADIGTPLSPRVGVAYTTTIGAVALKVRGAYGRSIRAPLPGLAFGSVSPAAIQLANPLLAPERQRGWDGGIDVVIGSRVTLGVTGFDQTADDLILNVQVATQPVPTDQYQNIGSVKNRGIEVEGTLHISHRLQLRGQYAYVDARIANLGPSFVGVDKVGDRPRGMPKHTAGGVLTFTLGGKTVITGGVTWVGSFRQFDQLATFGCLGGSAPCPASFIADYPGFAKANASLSHQITPQVSSFVAVDNLANKHAYEGSNILPLMGRLTSVGVKLRH